MKMPSVLILSLVAVCRGAMLVTKDSPITKAIQLLGDLQGKIIREGEEAQKVYEEYSEFCEDRSRELSHEIKTGKAEAAQLEAAAAEAQTMEGSLRAEVERLAGEISVNEADLKAAAEIRKQEHDEFLALEAELSEVVSAVQRAVGILEREMGQGHEAFVQLRGAKDLAQAFDAMVQASMLSVADAGKLTSMIQASSEGEQAPAAPIYESQSGNIVEVLSDLLDKAQGQLADARKKEQQDQHAFEMMEQSLKEELRIGNKEMTEAKAGASSAAEGKASARGELEVTSKELAADEGALSDTHHECMTLAQDFEVATKSRGEELKALAEAKKVLTEKTGASGELSYSFLQVSAASRITSRAGLAGLEVAHLIRDLSRKVRSAELAQLASRVASGLRGGDDQFGNVKGLIRDMIQRLETEAEKDATKKDYCDKELAESNQKKGDKHAEVQKLSTAIDKMTARSAKLKEEVAELQKGLSLLAAAQAEMDRIRSDESVLFAANKADMQQGLEGVKLALKILNEYYAREDKAHDAAEGAGSTVIALLEVVESDFSKGLAEMVAAEESAEAAYTEQTKESQIERAAKEQDVKYKTKESVELDKRIAETGSDRSSVQAQLDAVLEYLKSIEAECMEKAETYAERHARFQAELDGLREALKILESETALLQWGRKSLKLRGAVRPSRA